MLSGILHSPLHHLGAAQSDPHGGVHGILLTHSLVENEVRDQRCADAVGAGAMQQRWGVGVLAHGSEDAIERRVRERRGTDGDVDVGEPQ